MPAVQEPSRLTGDNLRNPARPPGLMSNLLTAAFGVLALAGVLVFSVLAFVAVTAVALVVGAYLWWNTGAQRRQMRERPPGGRIIQGEVIRDNPSPHSGGH
jgi:hypothetical protein